MFKNDPDKSIDMLASGGAAVLANDGAATGCVEVTEAEAAVASKPLDEKSDNRGYGNVSAGVEDGSGAGADTAPNALSNEEVAETENLEPVRTSADRRLVYRVVKRAFDVVFSAGVTVVLAIPVAIVCVAILIESPGAPMYSQERRGKGGKVIRVLKLRSMVADADDVEKHLGPDQLKQWEMERKVDDDPRVDSRIIETNARRPLSALVFASAFPPKMTVVATVFPQVNAQIIHPVEMVGVFFVRTGHVIARFSQKLAKQILAFSEGSNSHVRIPSGAAGLMQPASA